MEFEIYFHDLSEEAQERLLEEFETTVDDENWEYSPIAVIVREND